MTRLLLPHLLACPCGCGETFAPTIGKRGRPRAYYSPACNLRANPQPRTSSDPKAGRAVARYWVPLVGDCERCGEKPAADRHHIDGNPLNNARENIALLCRRCHMDVDGRLHGALRQKHCKKGHELTPENTYVTPAGSRTCRECKRVRERTYREDGR